MTIQLDVYNNYKKTYQTPEKYENKEMDWIEYIRSLNFFQISLFVAVFAIVYFIDRLNMFNAMNGFMGPSPVFGVSSIASAVATKKKKKT
jgi:hypothetical protein